MPGAHKEAVIRVRYMQASLLKKCKGNGGIAGAVGKEGGAAIT